MRMQVHAVARIAALSPHAVRYYVRRGLLVPRRDPKSGYHSFDEADVHTLGFIRRAKALGFTLAEIETVLKTSRRRESPCPMVRDIVRRRLDEFRLQLDELDETCRRMGRALARWKRMPDSVPTGSEICRLIESVGQ